MYIYYNGILDLLRDMQYCIVCKSHTSCQFDLYLSGAHLNSSIHYRLQNIAASYNMVASLISERKYLTISSNMEASLIGFSNTDQYALSMMPNHFYITEIAQALPHNAYHVNIGADCSCGRYSTASADIQNQQIIDLRSDYTTKSFTHNDQLYRIQINHYLNTIHLETGGTFTAKLFKLPYFEVDFTDIPKLVNKINTLITFS